MIVELLQNITYIFKALPEKNKRRIVNGKKCNMLISGAIGNNHYSNVSAYAKLLAYSFINFKESKMYLLFDTVELINKIRNNLLSNEFYIASFHIPWSL